MAVDRNHALIRTVTIALAAFVASQAWQGVAFAQEGTLVLNGDPKQGAAAELAAEPAATSSLLVLQATPRADEVNLLRQVSMFAIAPAESRIFHEHDLIQIIVRESTAGQSTHETQTSKKVTLNGAVTQWPDLAGLLNGVLHAGNTANLPQVDLQFTKKFDGDGDYKRSDDFTARLTAEVLQVLPNGNLILESRTQMKQDSEEFMLTVTGTCRPEDVSPANTIFSSQLHDLKIEKVTV